MDRFTFAGHDDNPFLQGPYAPTVTERVITDFKIFGQIPDDLAGVYLRNGPNPKFNPAGTYHWFDGDGMVHGFYFQNGKLTYRNRWIKTQGLIQEEGQGKSSLPGVFSLVNPAETKDTANTDIIVFNKRAYGLWYRSGMPYALDPITLETLGIDSFSDTLQSPISAHAKVDPVHNELRVFCVSMKQPYLSYGVINEEHKVRHWTPIELPGLRLPHDMAITTNYSIVMDLPLYYVHSPNGLRSYFDHTLPARFGILPRLGNEQHIQWLEAEPCYIYHVINAWEREHKIEMLVCRVTDPVPPLKDKAHDPLLNMVNFLGKTLKTAQYYYYCFDLKSRTVEEQPLDSRNSEFPVINQRYMGQPSRYSYHVLLDEVDLPLFSGLIKYDYLGKHTEAVTWPKPYVGNEPVFAPKAKASSEDDGYILTILTSCHQDQSRLLILDAKHITAPPLATIDIPAHIPIGFHGCWAEMSQI
ncbi:carotenoid oxygenase family protein [Zooshikella marina]|uniref:carotenoid oxygenase family protein n=1 Tax=Zooshikella ganghwensis TaxID=202772 RepID=UPI001BAFB2D9|nr:carotenoid oxygenase family protein [Zooshikella ganghwensis]MBU2705864.1 carotenoid oxygenase family protein [Zooshikella ganghwensis]